MTYTRLKAASTQEWLERRRKYITATDISRLWTSPAEWAAVRSEKAGIGDGFTGNAYTDWGQEREPALIEYAAQIDGSVKPNRDLLIAEHGAFAATPDGLGDGFVVECKTGSESGLRSAATKYEVQAQWQMHVTGVDRCLMVQEVRLEEGGLFSPGPRSTRWIERDQELIELLILTAERFLRGIDWGMEQAIAEYLEAKADRDKAQSRMDDAGDRLRLLLGGEGTYAGEIGRVSIKSPSPSLRVDAKALAREEPDVFARFSRLQQAKPRLVVSVGGA